MATAVLSSDGAPRRWRLRLPERLPNLTGKGLIAYTIIWAILLPLSLIAAARGSYISLTTPTMWTPYGFSTTDHPEGLRIDAVTSPQVSRLGVRAGDFI